MFRDETMRSQFVTLEFEDANCDLKMNTNKPWLMKLIIIQQKIYEVRGERVMFDFDLAQLYGVETRRLNEQVKRNADRFPKDFMFRLTQKEWQFISSQIATSSSIISDSNSSQIATSSRKHRGKTYLPYAFTEHGVTMLANVLKSKKAIKMSIAVVRAFISLKQMALQHTDLAEKLEDLRKELHERIGEHDTQLAGIYNAIENLLDEKAGQKNWKERERIGFKK
jgi:phage regulator Rha-like protein